MAIIKYILCIWLIIIEWDLKRVGQFIIAYHTTRESIGIGNRKPYNQQMQVIVQGSECNELLLDMNFWVEQMKSCGI